MRFVPCMGGFCALRERCAHYHAEARWEPSERLCRPGQDGISDVVPAMHIAHPRLPFVSNLQSRSPDEI